MGESPCGSKHGDGGPRGGLEQPMAAVWSRVGAWGRRGRQGFQMKSLTRLPFYIGSRLRAEIPAQGWKLRPNRKFRTVPDTFA